MDKGQSCYGSVVIKIKSCPVGRRKASLPFVTFPVNAFTLCFILFVSSGPRGWQLPRVDSSTGQMTPDKGLGVLEW